MSDSDSHGFQPLPASLTSVFDRLGCTLRAAVSSDARGVKWLVQLAFEKYIPTIGGTPRTMLRDYAQVIHQDQVWVIEADGALIAVLVLASCDHHFHVSTLAVHPDWQGRGLGKALLHHAEQQSQQAGYGEIWLHTNGAMVSNIGFYTSLGYEEMYRKTYHATPSIYMRKILNL